MEVRSRVLEELEGYFKRRKQEGGNGGLFSCGADGLHGWLLVAGGERCGGDLDRGMAGKDLPCRIDMVVEWLDARAECGRCGVNDLCFCLNRMNRSLILLGFDFFQKSSRMIIGRNSDTSPNA
jgi:hypothetical protein